MATEYRALPGFHVANLAAAMAASGRRVLLHEWSGVQPSAAYFLSLPPAVFLAASVAAPVAGGDAPVVFSAIDRVALTFDRRSPDLNLEPEVEVYHVHPEDVPEFDRAVTAWVCLGAGPLPYVNSGASVVRVGLTSHRRDSDPAFDATLPSWRRSATDRLPAVVRDPNSRLARSYKHLVEKVVLSRRSVHDAPTVSAPSDAA